LAPAAGDEAAHLEATLLAIFPEHTPTLRSTGAAAAEGDSTAVQISRREVWRTILMAIVGLLVLESLMAMAFNRSSTAD
jgi:hypothetical protein